MQDDTEVLDEVVVVGYGVQKKSSLTGAVASISSQEISKQVSSNVASSLQGRTPGVDLSLIHILWENNGPKVDSVIRERAGLEAGYKDLLNIQ